MRSDRSSGQALALLLAVLAIVLVAGACSSESDEGSSGVDKGGSTTEPATECERLDGVEVEMGPEVGEDGDATEQVAERGEPGVEMITEQIDGRDGSIDLIEGAGEEVMIDGSATIQYSLVNAEDGSVLESSWETSGPSPLAVSQAFPRFGECIDGMKVGGRRAFTAPAKDVAGGDPPPESGIGPDDQIIMVIDLVSTSEAPEPPEGAVEPDEDALAAAEERGAPEMSAPDGTAETTELVVIDDVVGDGAEVEAGDTVLAHYSGIKASDGEQFDSSWERGEPAEFGLDQVIPGWTEGLVGMKVGGRRTLVIPTDQAYGEDAAAQGKPEGVLVFTIDLIGVS